MSSVKIIGYNGEHNGKRLVYNGKRQRLDIEAITLLAIAIGSVVSLGYTVVIMVEAIITFIKDK
jgi:hypothetical protein